jgi:pimeloyl-ACP methyl ester carboxylesterase
MQTRQHRVPNGAGWDLSVFQSWDEERLARARSPVLLVSGYGTRSLLFSFHPSGRSQEAFLVDHGFEVWRADLRAHGESRCLGGSADYGMDDLALHDLWVVLDCILARTHTRAERVDVIGASLGGTLMFAHAALSPAHRIGAMVSIGSPVRWVKAHPLLRLAGVSPALAGLVPARDNQRLAEALLPRVVRHAPWLLRSYLNPEITELGAAGEMVKVVEKACRRINREIAAWVRDRDLVLRGVNVSERLSSIVRPLLCVVANNDGLVPRETAEFPYWRIGSRSKRLLEVGTRDIAIGHADLFLSREAHGRVFEPIARWLMDPDAAGEDGGSSPASA